MIPHSIDRLRFGTIRCMQQKLHTFLDRMTPDTVANIWYATFLFWLPVIVFLALANEVLEKEPLALDLAILTTIHAHATPFWDTAVLFVTALGGAVFVVPIVIILVGLLYAQKKFQAARIVMFIAGGAGVINILLKLFFQRDRPSLWESVVVETSYSFPSGHAMASSALALSLMLITRHTKWRRLVVIVGSFYILIVGFTRVYLGVHYPSDILAGWCVSLLWATIAFKVVK